MHSHPSKPQMAAAKFFGTIEPEVELLRGKTIAEGARECAFNIRFKQP